MAYLLLWSSIERYCSFVFGPSLDPGEKIKGLDSDQPFCDALKTVSREDKVYDTRDPKVLYKLNSENPSHSRKYYYQIRNNLSHRGKGAWKDGEKVRLSLIELYKVFLDVLIVRGLTKIEPI